MYYCSKIKTTLIEVIDWSVMVLWMLTSVKAFGESLSDGFMQEVPDISLYKIFEQYSCRMAKILYICY